ARRGRVPGRPAISILSSLHSFFSPLFADGIHRVSEVQLTHDRLIPRIAAQKVVAGIRPERGEARVAHLERDLQPAKGTVPVAQPLAYLRQRRRRKPFGGPAPFQLALNGHGAISKSGGGKAVTQPGEGARFLVRQSGAPFVVAAGGVPCVLVSTYYCPNRARRRR